MPRQGAFWDWLDNKMLWKKNIETGRGFSDGVWKRVRQPDGSVIVTYIKDMSEPYLLNAIRFTLRQDRIATELIEEAQKRGIADAEIKRVMDEGREQRRRDQATGTTSRSVRTATAARFDRFRGHFREGQR